MRRIAAHYIYTPSGFLKNGIIAVNSKGVITDISVSACMDSVCGVEFYPGIIIPGMINAHTHIELSYLRGIVPSGCGFSGFAQSLKANRTRFTDKQIHDAIDYHDAKMWSEGVQAAGDISNSLLSKKVKQQSKIKYHTFAEVYGLNTSSLSEIKPIYHSFSEGGLPVSITPHSTYSLNDNIFIETINSYPDRSNSPLSIHFMESQGERLLFDNKGELHDWYINSGFQTDFTGKYSSPAERITSCVPAERKIMLIHNTYIDEHDIEILTNHFGENITYVLCPRSNMHITGQLPPWKTLLNSGVKIAIGTDSLASNTDLSVIEELKILGDNVPLEESLKWITINGAEALGCNDHMGTLEIGKCPGIILLEKINLDILKLTKDTLTRRLI